MTKTCIKCHQKKELSEFPKDKGCSDGRKNSCRLCVNAYWRNLYHSNEKMRIGARERSRRKKANNRIIKKQKRMRISKICIKCNQEKTLSEFPPAYDKSIDGTLNRCKKCINKYSYPIWRKYSKRRLSTVKGRLDQRMSRNIWEVLRSKKNGARWGNLLNYTAEDLKNHLEKLFTPRMNWNLFMQGKIHIDHIIPRSSFNYSTPDDVEFKQCWSLENLQPLWAKDNLKKGNRVSPGRVT